ncbi:MAG: Asp-tRNA(Asn)/Glu-tRNA(Gln) amidotransferase subunit GatA [Bacteroidetes bacterium]|nr:Asp-tRNA(Asn)/Glu-tRNA(Gln) amidotransferase subunit GatA [Bacteroidota bacterium]
MYQFQSISQYHDALTLGQISCEEVVTHFLEKIDATKELNAFVEVFREEAISKARELDAKRNQNTPLGKLHGVVVSIKDVICYKDHQVTAASKMLKDFKSVYNATVVDRLLSADAIIIGVCNCDEFAMGSTNETSVYGPVRNAKDKNRISGGSSGGSAVAVQAGLCMVSLGSDTGGSVRQPADYCGIVGYKPSYGTISRYGLIAYASSFDQIGIFAQNTDDISRVLDTIKGSDNFDSTISQQTETFVPENKDGSRQIALFKNALEYASLDSEIKKAIYILSDKLKNFKHHVVEKNFDLIDYIVPAYYILTTAEASSNLSRYDGIRYGHRTAKNEQTIDKFYKANRSEGFGIEVKKRIMLGSFVLSEGYFDAYFTKAQKVRQMLVNQTQHIFEEYDFIMLPTVIDTAGELGAMKKDTMGMYLSDIYTVFANLTGLPAISIPLFKHSNGMPFGVQLVGKKNSDQQLLEFSNYILEHFKEKADV